MREDSTVKRVVLAVVVGVVTALVLALVGSLLETVDQETIAKLGKFLQNYSFLFGLLAGVWYFFTGRTLNDSL